AVEYRRCPEGPNAVEEVLSREVVLEIDAEEFDLRIDRSVRTRRIVTRRRADCDCGERRTVIPRCLRFPGLQTKIKPVPRAFLRAVCGLGLPEVGERLGGRGARAGAALITVVERQDESAQDRFGSPRLFFLPLVEIIEEAIVGSIELRPGVD